MVGPPSGGDGRGTDRLLRAGAGGGEWRGGQWRCVDRDDGDPKAYPPTNLDQVLATFALILIFSEKGTRWIFGSFPFTVPPEALRVRSPPALRHRVSALPQLR